MGAEPLRLDDLLESVADGSAVDWDAAEARANEGERRIIRHLRIVAGIAEVHRTTPGEDTLPSPSTPLLEAPESGRSGSRWGHLLLLQTIGEGAFGQVYRARDPWLDREVALKLLKPDVAAHGTPDRIVNEARTLARVRHPNVVTVHGADMHDGRVGLWMEFVRGRTISQIVATQGPFSASEASVAGQELCRALAAVHAAGLVHRDVKAQNVMRESGGRLVLMDFGAGHTPLYLAPELLHGAEPSARTDIYALGVLLYYMVTGSYPVVGTSISDLERAHASGTRRRLGDVRADLPDGFVAVVERALRPDPLQRFATAREMQEALSRGTGAGTGSRPAIHAPVQSRRQRWHIPALVAALIVAVAGAAIYRSTRSDSDVAHAAVRMVAVLPLQPMSGTDAYVAAGLTEALTQELSMAGPLQVISRTSVDRLVGDRTPLRNLAAALNADAIIEGSVAKSDDKITVNVRVIQAGTDSAVWARTFERTAADISTIQREIARAVANEFRVALAPQTLTRLQSTQQINPVAYEEYMRGRYEYRRQSQPGVEGAVTHFERAIALEPRYARAHASLAQSYVLLGRFGALDRQQIAKRAREAATRALELDEAIPDAHAVMARLESDDWNFENAEARYRRAVGLDPSFVEPRLAFALFLAGRGKFDEAFTHLATARNVDPLSSDVADRTAVVYYYARRFPEALVEVQRATQLDPENVGTQLGLVRILNATGRYDEAFATAERAGAQAANHPWFQAEMALAEIGDGRVSSARARIRTLLSPRGEPAPRVTPMTLAVVFAPLDRNEAFRWLQREFDARSPGLLWVKVDPRLDPLRTDARFRDLLKRLQLEP